MPQTAMYEVVGDSKDRELWKATRGTGVGASEMPVLFGLGRNRGAIDLWAEKVGLLEPEDISRVKAVKWGNRLERAVLEGYAEDTGRVAARSGLLLRSREYPWALATLDGWTNHETGMHGPVDSWPLEIKTAGSWLADEWVDGPPPAYFVQVQHQMLVTGAERATVAVLIGGQDDAWADVPRDEDTIKRIVEVGSEFWALVLNREMPRDAHWMPSAAAALKRLYPKERADRVVDLSGELEGAGILIADLRRRATALEKEADAIASRVKVEMGLAEIGVLPSGDCFTWKTQDQKAQAPRSFRVLRYKPRKEQDS